MVLTLIFIVFIQLTDSLLYVHRQIVKKRIDGRTAEDLADEYENRILQNADTEIVDETYGGYATGLHYLKQGKTIAQKLKRVLKADCG